MLDVETGRLASAKRFGTLLMAAGDDYTVVLPDGTVLRLAGDDGGATADRDGTNTALSAWLGRDVRLVRNVDQADLTYQMTFDPPNDEAELFDIPVPAGTLVDLAPIHLLNEATLAHCRQVHPDLNWDVRRFRPNIVVDVDAEPFAENGWAGSSVEIGDVVLGVPMATVRCAMPLRAQPGLLRQAAMFAAMNELNPALPNHLGLYLTIQHPGTIRTGDPVSLAA